MRFLIFLLTAFVVVGCSQKEEKAQTDPLYKEEVLQDAKENFEELDKETK